MNEENLDEKVGEFSYGSLIVKEYKEIVESIRTKREII
jgi:hypothetical protein